MRIFRIIAIVGAGVLGLVVVAVIALLLLVDPNRYRGDIERAAREHTSRVLAIHGPLKLKIFPWLALSVRDVELGNPPGFGARPFMTGENLSIGVKLLPLLGKRLQVSRVALEGVHLNLVNRGERNNWQDLGGSESSAGSPPSGGPPATPSLSIEGV